jgi:hypothetical protein
MNHVSDDVDQPAETQGAAAAARRMLSGFPESKF